MLEGLLFDVEVYLHGVRHQVDVRLVTLLPRFDLIPISRKLLRRALYEGPVVLQRLHGAASLVGRTDANAMAPVQVQGAPELTGGLVLSLVGVLG